MKRITTGLIVKSQDAHYIHDLHSKENLLDNTVALGNKTGWQNGDLSDKINNHLIEKGYQP